MRHSSPALALATMLASCGGGGTTGGSGTDETASGGEAATAPARTPEQACLAMATRERECQEQFLPALVALRVHLDLPPGTAASDASHGRDALVAQARTQYTAGATDEVFRRNCAQMAQLPPERASSWNEMMQGCLPAADCAAFVECDMRFTEARFSAH